MNEEIKKEHKQIIDEWFINGFNGTKAWMKYNPKSSEDAARSSFSRLLTNANIEQYIEKKQKESEKINSISHQRILSELINWAYSDLTEFIYTSLEDIKTMPPEIRRLVTGFTSDTWETSDKDKNVTKRTKIKLTFADKKSAIEMISKHTGFFGEHNFQKNASLSDEARESRIRELKNKLFNKDTPES